jgi:hypothetical protein
MSINPRLDRARCQRYPLQLEHVRPFHSLALAESFPQLLAFHRQFIDERGAQAFTRGVLLDHDAIRLLQALRQCVS